MKNAWHFLCISSGEVQLQCWIIFQSIKHLLVERLQYPSIALPYHQFQVFLTQLQKNVPISVIASLRIEHKQIFASTPSHAASFLEMSFLRSIKFVGFVVSLYPLRTAFFFTLVSSCFFFFCTSHPLQLSGIYSSNNRFLYYRYLSSFFFYTQKFIGSVFFSIHHTIYI